MIHITQDNFNESVLNADKTVVLDFWAPGCATCLNNVNPIIEQLNQEIGNKVIFAKVNAYEQAGIASQLRVRALPTVLFIQNGIVVDRLTSSITSNQVLQKLNM